MYSNLQNEMIRDRIVVAIRNVQLSEKLQIDSELTLENAITPELDHSTGA